MLLRSAHLLLTRRYLVTTSVEQKARRSMFKSWDDGGAFIDFLLLHMVLRGDAGALQSASIFLLPIMFLLG